jgi:hypothetical protein
VRARVVLSGGVDGEPPWARYLVPTAGADNTPPPRANPSGDTMTSTRRPRFIHSVLLLLLLLLLLLRDALGRFVQLRMPKIVSTASRRPKRMLTLPVFIALF